MQSSTCFKSIGTLLIVIALGACQAEMRKDGAPTETVEEEAMANPPRPGDDFFEVGEVPKGAPLVKDYDPSLQDNGVGQEKSAPPAPVTEINRASISNFVKNGPRHPLKMVEVQPAFRGSEFIGYQITAFSHEGAKSFGSAIKAGDIVIAVNDRNLAMPEDYMAAWESLSTCERVSVRLIRSGRAMSLSWPVVD
jgi:hypothetical protein